MVNANMYQILRTQFANNLDAIFLDAPNLNSLSYGTADKESSRMASALRSMGVFPGDRVMVQVEKSPQAVLLYLACLRAGVIYIPLNTSYVEIELDYFLKDAEPKLLVCDPKIKSLVNSIAKKNGVNHIRCLNKDGLGSWMETVEKHNPSKDITKCMDDDIAAILYTSGTTGRPKGAMLTHLNLASNALELHRLWNFCPGDVLLHALPIYHVHGLFVAIHCAMLNVSKVWFLPHFEQQAVLNLIPHSTIMMGIPTFYVRLLNNSKFNKKVCDRMRLFISGSAPLLNETFDAFEVRTGHRILERYGMTEAGMITSNPYGSEKGGRVRGTVGFALPNVVAKVCDTNGNELPQGKTGVLEIKGPNVFKGYWRDPKKTKMEFRRNGFFITGDMSKIDSDGRLSIVGRMRDLIITGGLNVYPREVEDEIDNIAGVAESAIIGVPHPDFGEGVIAIIVLADDMGLSSNKIMLHLTGKLAKFKLPKRIFFISEFPRNSMGKVQKQVLRDQYAGAFSE